MTFDASELREIDDLLREFDRLLYKMNWMSTNPRVRIAVLLKKIKNRAEIVREICPTCGRSWRL